MCFGQASFRTILDDLPGTILDIAIAPKGDTLAFGWCQKNERTCGVYLRPLSGGEPKLLFTGKEYPLELRWSPDGRWLAYSDIQSHDGAILFVRNVNGGAETQIGVICGGYSWTADSQALIASAGDGTAHGPEDCALAAYSRDGRLLGRVAPKGSQPAVSPDGTNLAFLRQDRLVVQPLSRSYHLTGQERILAESASYPVWLSDRELLYQSDGPNPLRRVPLAPRSRTSVVLGLNPQTELTRLTTGSNGSAIAKISLHDSTLSRVSLNSPGALTENLQSIPYRDDRHNISPDGRRVVFVRQDLWVSNVDGSEARMLAKNPERYLLDPKWSPDGNSIAFSAGFGLGHGDDHARLYTVSANGGALRRLLPNDDDVYFCDWSADGEWLYYITRYGLKREGPQLWKFNVRSNERKLVTSDEPLRATESRDGNSVYYVSSPGRELINFNPARGTTSKIMRAVTMESMALGMRQMIFSDYRAIRKLDLESGETSVVMRDVPATGLQLSPDERFLYFTATLPAKESWILLENIR